MIYHLIIQEFYGLDRIENRKFHTDKSLIDPDQIGLQMKLFTLTEVYQMLNNYGYAFSIQHTYQRIRQQ